MKECPIHHISYSEKQCPSCKKERLLRRTTAIIVVSEVMKRADESLAGPCGHDCPSTGTVCTLDIEHPQKKHSCGCCEI